MGVISDCVEGGKRVERRGIFKILKTTKLHHISLAAMPPPPRPPTQGGLAGILPPAPPPAPSSSNDQAGHPAKRARVGEPISEKQKPAVELDAEEKAILEQANATLMTAQATLTGTHVKDLARLTEVWESGLKQTQVNQHLNQFSFPHNFPHFFPLN